MHAALSCGTTSSGLRQRTKLSLYTAGMLQTKLTKLNPLYCRYEIKRLREQVQMLLQRAPVEMDFQRQEMQDSDDGNDRGGAHTAPLQRPGTITPAAIGEGGGVLPRERSRSSLAGKTAAR